MRIRSRMTPNYQLVNLTPLVDVVLLILIFFLITSDILPLKSLQTESPELDIEAPALTAKLLIVIDQEGIVYVGAKRNIVSPATLPTLLENLLDNEGTPPTAVLHVDKRVDFATFLRVFATVQECCPRVRLAFHTPA